MISGGVEREGGTGLCMRRKEGERGGGRERQGTRR